MALSPNKQRTLSRQPSHPSLAIGLPPALPEPHSMMASSSSSRSLASKSRKKHPSRRGDVSSSNASSPEASEDEWSLPITPSSSTSTVDPETTPKRRVVALLDGSKTQPRKRDNLQARLQAAAKLQKSRSHGEGLTDSPSIGHLVPKVKLESVAKSTSGVIHSGSSNGSKDKVVVCVRIKPTNSTFVNTAYELTSTSLTLSDKHPNVQKRGGKAGREDEYTYNFDALLQQPSRTPDLYERRIAPLVDKAMNGYNSTIFAYGQTGSGKSHTMTGVEEELGVIPCAVDGVFDAINADPERAFLLRVSYIEIYNETLRDLLNFKKGPLRDEEKPNIHFNKGKVYVDPLVEEIVSTPQDVVDLLEKGNTQRKTGQTDWNERSSRSHSVFTIVIESKPRDGNGDDDVRLSRLTLIDLAGSEKAVSDLERRGEGKHINRSLLALKTVINKLTDKKSGHIPYRDSKLTHLLENALGGDSNICVICTLSGEEDHHAETLETLKFAGNCARVETKAKKNILMSSEQALIKAKDKEIEILRRRLEGLVKDDAHSEGSVSSDQVQNLADSVAAMEARKNRLHTQLAKLNTQVLTSELPRAGHGVPSLTSGPKRRRISDLYSVMGTNRVGLGSPKQKALDNRRAVSSALRMPQVLEDEMPTIHTQLDGLAPKTFDHDRIVAALRRALASRDQELTSRATELDSAIEQITQLQAELSILEGASGMASTQHEADLLDFHNRLESTRTELVNTINEKAEKIDTLESTVLDLRTSREEVMLEGEIRADELKAQLVKAVEETSELKASHTTALETLRAEVTDATSKLAEMGDVQRRLEEVDQERQSALQSLEEQKKITLVHEEEIAKYRTLAEVSTADLEKLRSEAYVRRNLEGDQAKLEAMLVAEREGRKMAEKDNMALVQQLGELRELKASKKDLDNEKRLLLEELEATKTTTAAHVSRMAEMTSSLEKVTVKRDSADKAATQSLEELTAAKQALHEQSSENYRLQMDLSTKTAESSNIINSLESQIMAEKARCQMLQESKSTVDAALEEQTKQLEAMSKDLDDFRAAVSASSTSTTKQAALILSLEEQVRIESGARKSSDEVRVVLEKEVVDLRAAVEGHETELVRFSAESEGARRKLDQLKVDIEEEKVSHKATEAKLGVAETAALDRQTRINGLDSELETAHAKLQDQDRLREEQERHLVDLSSQLDQANRERSRAEEALNSTSTGHTTLIASLRSEVDRHQSDLRDKEAALASMTKAVDDAQSARSLLESEMANLRAERATIEAALSKDYKALQACLDASAGEVEAARADLAAAELARTDLQTRHDSLSRDLAGDLQDAVNQVSLSEKKIGEMTLRIADLEGRLLSSEAGRQDAEKKFGALLAGGTAKDIALKEVQEHVTILQRDHDQQGALLSTTKIDLDARVAALAAVETTFKSAVDENRNLSAKVNQLVKEMDQQRAVLKDTQAQLDKARSDLVTVNATSKKLSEDLASARADAATRPRHASTPTGSHTGTAVLDNLRIQALKSASTGESAIQDKLRTKESGEISRLEKVVEAQKEVIDDQREKIKFWAKELEQQRDIVRMLTQDGSSMTTPTKNSPRPTHAKAKSMSAANLDSPGPGSSHARVHLPNSFTAKNLALPTTPTPLPMHPSQISNTSTRRGRRITIDHDLDLLTESSKVNKAKAVFDSPEKKGSNENSYERMMREQEERAAIALTRKKTVRLAAFAPTGSPVQRRP